MKKITEITITHEYLVLLMHIMTILEKLIAQKDNNTHETESPSHTEKKMNVKF